MAPSSLYVPSGLSPDEDGMGGGFLEADTTYSESALYTVPILA